MCNVRYRGCDGLGDHVDIPQGRVKKVLPLAQRVLKIFYYSRWLLFYTFVQNKHKSITFLIRTPGQHLCQRNPKSVVD